MQTRIAQTVEDEDGLLQKKYLVKFMQQNGSEFVKFHPAYAQLVEKFYSAMKAYTGPSYTGPSISLMDVIALISNEVFATLPAPWVKLAADIILFMEESSSEQSPDVVKDTFPSLTTKAGVEGFLSLRVQYMTSALKDMFGPGGMLQPLQRAFAGINVGTVVMFLCDSSV